MLEQIRKIIVGILKQWFTNKSTLDKLSDENGELLFNNTKIMPPIKAGDDILPFRFGITDDNEYGYILNGSNEVIPFRPTKEPIFYGWGANSKNYSTYINTATWTATTDCIAIAVYTASTANYAGEGGVINTTFTAPVEPIDEMELLAPGSWGWSLRAKAYKLRKGQTLTVTGSCPSGNAYVGHYSSIFYIRNSYCDSVEFKWINKTSNTSALSYTHTIEETDKYICQLAFSSGGNVNCGGINMSSTNNAYMVEPDLSINKYVTGNGGYGYNRAGLYEIPQDSIGETFTVTESGSTGSATYTSTVAFILKDSRLKPKEEIALTEREVQEVINDSLEELNVS